MDAAHLGMKTMKIISKPVQMFFGSDRKSFMTLLLSCLGTYFMGFPDAATIFAVYSAMFGFSGMVELGGSAGNTQGNGKGLEDIENMMNDALDMAQDFQEETEADKQ